MRYRVADVAADRVLMTADGPMAVARGDVVLTAVVDNIDDAVYVMAELERRRRERK